MPSVSDRTASIGTLPVFWREAPAADGAVMPLYLHGVPTNSDDWLPFLARTGVLAPDLPGFGRSGKAGNLDYTIDGYAGRVPYDLGFAIGLGSVLALMRTRFVLALVLAVLTSVASPIAGLFLTLAFLLAGHDHVSLARGWERQLDTRYAALFYRPTTTLTPSAYRAWLYENRVVYVALADARLDYAGRAEGALVARGLPYLREVWRSPHWRLYALDAPSR